MATKQESPRASQNASSAPAQSTVQSLIFSNVYFEGTEQKLLNGLRRHYKGVQHVVPLYVQDNDGKSIRAIRIDMTSDDLVKQFTDTSNIRIDEEEYPIQSLTRSVIVSKVASSETQAKLLQDLPHNYLGVEKISRFYGKNRKSVDDIRIDFKSDSSPTKIIKDNYIIIDGKRRPVQPYWSFVYIPSQNQNGKGHTSEESQTSVTKPAENSLPRYPKKYLTEQRVKELFREQQKQLGAMMNEFEDKWNARLSSLTSASANANVDQLLPIFKDLTTTCQQFNQQNAQMQRQLGSVVHRIQDVQMKLNTEHERPQLPIQNGH